MLAGKGEMPSSLTSTELNYLVFRYLQESGLTHSAFALGYEAGIDKCPIDGHMIPPGALVKIVQKGLQYVELEANNDIEEDDDFTFVEPLELITMDVHELHRVIKEKKENLLNKQDKEKDKMPANEKETTHGHEWDVEMNENVKEQKNGMDKQDNDKKQDMEREREKKWEEHKEMESNKDPEDKMKIVLEGDRDHGGPEPMEIVSCSPFSDCEVPSSHVTVLKGHTSEVFACAWSPTTSLLASGSGDSTARIWCLPHGPSTSNTQTGVSNAYVLKHFKGKTNEKCKDVTTLDWKGDGTLLASGSYDGNARIWGRDGELKNTLSKHKGPIFSLKWNKKGDYLLSGSVDKTAIVWDTQTGECKQQFEFHSAPTLDVDWRNDVSFATCSTDHMIYVCKIGEHRPIKALSGHQGEVNAIKWDPTGSLLASCSDDHTAKIWSLKHDKLLLHDLSDHEKEIYTIRWSPTGPRTCNPNQQLVLASASFDSTIKLWNAEVGKLLHTLHGHRHPVYSVAFSPNGEYLASGSLDQSLHIWSIKQGKLVKTYNGGGGGIFEVSWNREGDKVAACFSNATVCVIDFRM